MYTESKKLTQAEKGKGGLRGLSCGRLPREVPAARPPLGQPRVLPQLSNCLARCGRGRFRVREHRSRPGPTFPSGFPRTEAKLYSPRTSPHWTPGEAEIPTH